MSIIKLIKTVEPSAPATDKIVLFYDYDAKLKTKDATGLVSIIGGGGGGDVYTDRANIFTQNQTIDKVRPELILHRPGDTTKARFLSVVPGGRVDLTSNLYYDDTGWMRDDITKPSGLATLFEGGSFGVWAMEPGANPANFVSAARFVVDTTGITTSYKTARPEYRLAYNSQSGTIPVGGYGRLFMAVPNDIRISCNVMYDGSGWALDDVSQSGAELELYSGGGVGSWLSYSTFTPGAYPRTGNLRFGIDNTGAMTCNGPINGQTITSAANFTGSLTVAGGVGISGKLTIFDGTTGAYNLAPLEIQTVQTPRISFHWPGVVAAQIGMNSSGTIVAYDNPGTGYAAFQCSYIYATATANSLGDLTCRGGTNFMGGIQSTSGIQNNFSGYTYFAAGIGVTGVTTVNTLNVNINHASTMQYMYPGRVDVAGGQIQANYYLASHFTYGLYINTGLYLAGALYTAGGAIIWDYVRAATGFLEYGRGNFLGSPIAWTPSVYDTEGRAVTAGGLQCYYYLIGKLLFWTIYAVTLGFPAQTQEVRFSVPIAPSMPNVQQTAVRCFVANAERMGYAHVDSSWIWMYPIPAYWQNVSNNHALGQGFYQIA